MRQVRIALWVLVGLAAIMLGFLVVRGTNGADITEQVGTVNFGGPFTLTSAEGEPFSNASLDGKPYAIFFGFTHCPDVCPTTLARIVQLRQQLGEGERPFEILFVTVDPERDGPEEVGKYAELFDTPIIGLTGTPAQIDSVKQQYGIFSQKVPHEAAGYTVDHTSSVLLFDRKGEFVATIAPEEGNEVALDKLRRII